MRYLHAKCKSEDRNEAYQIYVTDRLMSITGADIRYADAVYGEIKKPEDAEEIKGRLKGKLNALRKE